MGHPASAWQRPYNPNREAVAVRNTLVIVASYAVLSYVLHLIYTRKG